VSLPDPQESAETRNAAAGSDVFVSHSSKDREAADAVSRALESRGIRCWMAPRDIRPGANWGESILEAIGKVKMMVLLLSANANASPQVLREVERAVNKSVVIIPVRIENVMPSASLEYFLSTAHWLDAFESPLDQHCRNLADTVQGMLRGKDFTRFASAPLAAPVRRVSRARLAAAAGVFAVLVVAAASFLAGGWWHRSKQEVHSKEQPVVAPPVLPTDAEQSTAIPSPPSKPAPPPSLEDFAGDWEVQLAVLQDVAGGMISYGPIRFTVGADGSVRGKAGRGMSMRNGSVISPPAPVVLDIEGRIANAAWKSHSASGVFLDREDFKYRAAEIAMTLSDGTVGEGFIAFTEGLPVVEDIRFSNGEASGQIYAKRIAEAKSSPLSGVRVDPLQPDDVVPDGIWFFWSRPGSESGKSEKVAELDVASEELVVRINGQQERLQKRSEKWNPPRDRGPIAGDEGEEVWSNARVEVQLFFRILQAEHGLTRYAGQMSVSASGETSVLMVQGETGS